MTSEVITGDMREVLKDYPASHFGSCVVDPPYEYNFMSSSWDNTGISFQKATWRAVYRVLKPGAWLFAFGGGRTFHRIGVAIEDAGFEMRGSIAWMHAQGYPKGRDASRTLDKTLGVRRMTDEPVTDLAKHWEGFRTALKPAHEPIILARKPMVRDLSENIRRFGTGALNIDASRTEIDEDTSLSRRERIDGDSGMGRYPADVILDPDMAALLDADIGEAGGNLAEAWGGSRKHVLHAEGKRSLDGHVGRPIGYGDKGGPSRFFYVPSYSDEDFPEAFLYVAKPVVSERDAGLDGVTNMHNTVKPVALMRYLVRMATPPGETCVDPFAGSGTTGAACALEGFDFVGVEIDQEYAAIARLRIAHALRGD